MDKSTIQAQLDKLTNDAAGIQASINNFQKEVEDYQQKINALTQSIVRHQGALNYNSILLEFARKQMEEAEKETLQKASQVESLKPQAGAKFKAIVPPVDGSI
jgi:chromosome segregation ATPase